MTRVSLTSPVAPLRASVPRVLIEVGTVWIVLYVLLHLIVPHYFLARPATIVEMFALAWGVLWPAWRLRRMPGPTLRRRIVRRSAAVALCAAGLTVETWILTFLLLPGVATGPHPWQLIAVAIFAVIFFLGARVVVVIGAAFVDWARGRLLRQLTVSHMAVIFITFAAMSALGSIAGLALVLGAFQPSPAHMASDVVYALRGNRATSPLNRQQIQQTIDLIESGHVSLEGAPLVSQLGGKDYIPNRITVLDTDGRIIAMALNAPARESVNLADVTGPLPHGVWRGLRAAALAGRTSSRTGQIVVHPRNGHGQTATVSVVYGGAPIQDSQGHTVAVAVVETVNVPDLASPLQILPILLVIFGTATFLLIGATFLPILGISSLFGYALARGLTRRIQAVSRVTTAIAAGDFTQRAPVTTRNEIGRLAADVNSMAAGLEETMAALRRARFEAESALRARQELVASISHELRTPLAILRAHLDTLDPEGMAGNGGEGGDVDVEVPSSTLRALRHETDRLSGLVDDLFTLARAETGALPVQLGPVDVAEAAREVGTLMRPLAAREGQITLAVEAPPDLPPARADGDRLRQILSNLVRNAVRHTPEGGIIVMSVAHEGPWIVASVADTGEGIAPEHLPRIFERFYRADQARTRGSGGTGLGLSIVKEFVELMDGRVEVESAVGEGSIFRVYLPLWAPASRALPPEPVGVGTACP